MLELNFECCVTLIFERINKIGY